MRQANRIQVLAYIRRRGPVSIPQIAAEVGLSRPTVGRIVTQLIDSGRVRSDGQGEGDRRGGRKPNLVSFDPACMSILGVDIGAVRLSCALADLEGTVHLRLEQPTGIGDGIEAVMGRLTRMTDQALQLAPPELASRLAAVGVSAPGSVAQKDGRWIHFATLFPGIENVQIASRLEERLQVPTLVENDVNAALLGERRWGAARGFNHVLYVNIGYGLGAGVMVGGRLYRGASGNAGEIADMAMELPPTQGEESNEAQVRLESWLSGMGIARQAFERLGEELSAEEVFRRSAAGDPQCRALVAHVVDLVTLMGANLMAFFDPEILILGGGVSRSLSMDLLTSRITERLGRPARVVSSALGRDASLMGAVALALSQAERRL
ncbi:hypothetical protein LIP_2074 [Limnochorda pilosa]|uniref:Uncharacterized protein n=2 Tax=Limnochorda pilosa TaxID=1555112 RepID=A0A0K2SLD6_LIMPI|nr:hypothetical protein LIP_2074 [Limnochorda pilosa]